MAGNEEVIESLKLEIDVGIKGGGELKSIQKTLEVFAETLTKVNAKLREYRHLVSTMPRVNIPSAPSFSAPSGSTPNYNSGVDESIPSTMQEASDSAREAEESIESATQATNRFSSAMHSCGAYAKSLGARIRAFAASAKNAGKNMRKAGEDTKKAGKEASKAHGHFGKLIRQFIRIAKMRMMRAIIRSIAQGLREGVQNLAHYDEAFRDTMSQLSTYTLYLKNAFGTLAKPLLEILIPILTKVISFIVEMINKINAFIAVLRGEKTYTAAKIVPKEYLEDVGDGAEDATEKLEEEKDAADNLKKSLMGFDEINLLSDPTKASSEKDSSKEKNAIDYSEMFEERDAVETLGDTVAEFAKKVGKAFDKLKGKWEEFKASWKDFMDNGGWDHLKEIGTNFLISANDVLFEWNNLNSEQIAKKVMAAVPTLLGFIIGTALGGPVGGIVGAGIGLAFGLLIDAVTFNNNGKLDAEEVASMVTVLGSTLLGTLVGAALKGPAGAMVGATIGLTLGALISDLTFDHDGVLEDTEVATMIAHSLTALCGGVIGFFAGGIKGALIGATIGVGLSLAVDAAFETLDPDAKFGESIGKTLDSIKKAFSDAKRDIKTNWDDLWKSIKDMGKGFKRDVVDPLWSGLKDMGTGFKEIYTTIKDGAKESWEALNDGSAAEDFKNSVVGGHLYKAVQSIKTFFTVDIPNAFTSFENSANQVYNNVVGFFTDIGNTINNGVRSFVNMILGGIEWLVNQVIYGLNVIVVKAQNIINNLPDKVVSALKLDKIFANQLSYIQIPRLATGGFPEDGLFMANHGELVGQFSNGRTAVANNEQIEAGIEEAAYRGFMRAMQYNNGGNGTTTFIAQLNGKTLFEEVVKQNRSATKAYGTSPLY